MRSISHAVPSSIPTPALPTSNPVPYGATALSSEPVIVADDLAKYYGEVHAVDGIDLRVDRGDIYGFLGRNGAGKTTTIRMLLGLIRPTAGDVELLERPITPDAQSIFARVGYLVERATAYPNLTVRENLEIQRRLTGSEPDAVGDVIDRLGIGRYADRRAAELSQGNRQRLALARAMVHRPEVLILDEPVNGLDPAGIVEIRHLFRQLADEEQVTIFLSSHILSEIAQIADRIGIIHDGKIVEDLSRDEWQARSRTYLKVTVSEPDRAASLLRERLEEVHIERTPEDTLQVVGAPEATPEIARLLVGEGFDIEELCPVQEALEDYFLRLTGGRS